MTPELRETLDWLRVSEYPTLTDAEILKATAGHAAVRKRVTKEMDYSDPTLEELMRQAEYVFSLDEGDQEIPEVDVTKLKPFKPRRWTKSNTSSQ